MERKHAVFLILGILGLFLSFRHFKDANEKKGETIASLNAGRAVKEKPKVFEAGIAAQRQAIKTKNSDSHKEKRIAGSRILREPKNENNLTTLRPDRRLIENAEKIPGTSWVIWEGVSALPKKYGKPKSFLTEISGYYLVSDLSGSLNESQDFGVRPLVVFNKRKGIAGVLTGTLQVVLKENFSIDDIANNYGLMILDSLPQLRTYFVTSRQKDFDVANLREYLRGDPGIEQIELEILSRRYDKN